MSKEQERERVRKRKGQLHNPAGPVVKGACKRYRELLASWSLFILIQSKCVFYASMLTSNFNWTF